MCRVGSFGPNSVFVLSHSEQSDIVDDQEAAEAEVTAVFGSAA